MKFLTEVRKVSKSVIDVFEVGYVPRDIDHQLRGRIVFPIRDPYGELVALATRDHEAERRKSFWHESFDKKHYLYGLYEAKRHIQQQNEVIIVEGQYDVLVLKSFGIHNVVAVCGTAISPIQVAILSRYCSQFVFCLDGDEGGDTTIEKMYELYDDYCLETHGIKFSAAILPVKKDPDDYIIERGLEQFLALISTAKTKTSRTIIR